MRWLFLFVAACGPHEDVTPQIEVAPYAAARLCYPCVQARSLEQRCAPEIHEACSELFSDLRRAPRVTLTP